MAFLLAGYGFARYRKRKNEAAGDDVVYENDGQVPSDFFESKDKNGKSGKDGVEATNSSVTNMATGLSSMAYSPSQIDATGEGDPVLEADVLLAYGRDQQAEEVLKEAEQHDPNRISIKVRLAEIYAARQDRISLAAVATSMEALTQRTGTEWEKIAELGRNLDATNVLYQNNAAEAASPVVASHTDEPGFEVEGASGFGPLSGLDFDAPSSKADETASASSTQQLVTDTSSVGEDLDLSLDLGEITPSKIDDLDSHLDFDVSNFNLENPDSVPAATEPAQLGGKPHADADFPSIETADFEATDGLGLELQQTDLAPVPASQEDLTKSLELDLSALSLDDSELSSTVQSHITTVSNTTLVNDALDDAAAASDPLFTKLALAKEFHSLGDAEGARALIQEVIDQAQGDLLEKAKALQEQLS